MYVKCNNNIVVFSPDGKRHRQVLFTKDGLLNPFVLDYDISTNRLLIVNDSDSAHSKAFNFLQTCILIITTITTETELKDYNLS
jgi:hypothetical protein